nr:hypothetical protein [uncultured Flavobacterium sp.]
MKIYNRNNFFKHTFCIFNEVNPNCLPHENPDYISKSNSSYFFTEEGVFRKSNHWGRAANCRWKLVSDSYKSQNTIVAYAKWTDFYPNNETEKLYFIRITENSEVNFHHKHEEFYTKNDVLRTALETSKRIKYIIEVIETTNWSKYIDYSDFNKLRELVVKELLFTNKTFNNIKKECNGKT